MISELIKKDATGRTTFGEKKTWKLSPDISIKGDDIYYMDKVKFGDIDEVNRIINVDRRKALEANNRRNPLLSHTALVPNVKYCILDYLNRHEYYTDSFGRMINSIHYPKHRFEYHLSSEQTKALMCKDEETIPNTPARFNDQAGHILATSCGGLPETINIFPQAYIVNNSSDWRSMENRIKDAINKDCEVIIKTTFFYKNECKRPYSYGYEIIIDSSSTLYEFENVNSTN